MLASQIIWLLGIDMIVASKGVILGHVLYRRESYDILLLLLQVFDLGGLFILSFVLFLIKLYLLLGLSTLFQTIIFCPNLIMWLFFNL